MTIDRETLGAFVDGELDEITRRRIEAELAENPVLAQQVEAERRLRAALQARFAPIADEPVPERLIAAVRAGAKVAPLTSVRPRRSWGMPQWAAIAATLVMGIVAGQQLQPARDVNGRGGALVASGELADALETQLASAQGPDAPVRIGLSFKAQDGAWCRTFEQNTLEGIACRSGDSWQLRRTMTSSARGAEYRQAGSSEIAAAAQAMAADVPLDAEAERAAVARGWR
jgi:hypothetical protein